MHILLADDHDLVRDTIAHFLVAEGATKVITVGTLDAAIDSAKEFGSFDVVLLDFNMPGMNGLHGLAKMQEANKGKPVAIISGTTNSLVAKETIEAGAAGYIPKTLGAKSIMSAIRLISSGEVFVPIDVMRTVEVKASDNLTKREADVLRYLCFGKANKEIARALGLKEATVKLHLGTICRKLGAKNRTHAAMIARDRGLF